MSDSLSSSAQRSALMATLWAQRQVSGLDQSQDAKARGMLGRADEVIE
jgi:hypothetical protein